MQFAFGKLVGWNMRWPRCITVISLAGVEEPVHPTGLLCSSLCGLSGVREINFSSVGYEIVWLKVLQKLIPCEFSVILPLILSCWSRPGQPTSGLCHGRDQLKGRLV
jgi:hypothetical protein